MDRIDLLLGLDTLSRTVDYQLVLAAKTDLSGLSTKQILQKDLKVVKSSGGDQVWPVTYSFFTAVPPLLTTDPCSFLFLFLGINQFALPARNASQSIDNIV